MHDKAAETMQQPDVVKTLARQGLTPLKLNPAEFSEFVRKDMARWAEVVKSAGLKLEN